MTASGVSSPASDAWTVGRVIRWAITDLRARGSDSPRLDAELLLSQVLGCDRIGLIVDSERSLEPRELAAYRQLHKRRRHGEPIAYLRGVREFYGRPFKVDARVLVPRPETEHLVETALERSATRSLSARILDVGTGSGCVALTLKKERPNSRVLASDISADALAVARSNAIELGALVGLFEANVYQGLEPLRGKLDAIVSNPPYIPASQMAELPRDVRDFEPHVALAAGSDGMAVTKRIVAGAPSMLAPGGVLALEVAAGGAANVVQQMRAAGFGEIVVARDYAGHERVVSGTFTAPAGGVTV